MISLAQSTITQEVRDNVNACLDENRIGQGRFNKQFEEDTAKYLGVKHAIVVNNGSMADIVALGALKAKYPDKTEVIVPAYTFIAQTNAILVNGLTPVFVDVGDDYQMDVSQVESKINDKTLCIFAVHLFGKACNILKSKVLADKYNIGLIEDCCEAFGGSTEYLSSIDGRPVEKRSRRLGSIGDFGTFSFFPSHTITSLDYQEKIVIKDKESGLISNIRIGDFVTKEDYKKYQCVSFDKEGNLSFQNITGTIEHPVNEKLYRLKLQTGRETTVSASHSIFTDSEIGIIPTKVSDLSIGDSIFVPNNLKCFGEDSFEVTISGYKKGSWEQYNSAINISEELAWLLGWYAAEGWTGKNDMPNYPITFSLHKKELPVANEISRISKKIFGAKFNIYDKGENGLSVQCGSSRSMYEFLLMWCGKLAENKKVPEFIFTSKESIKKSFLDAYYQGDGCEHPTFTNGGGLSMDSKTISRELAEGIYYLLLSLGINSRISKENGKNDVIILGNICDTQDVYSVCYSKNSIVNSNNFRGGKRKKKYNDISLAKILSIEEIESTTPNVYDLTVDGYENFIGGMAVCLHNTGEGGMIITNDDNLAELARQVMNHGRRSDNILEKFTFDVFGYNGKMSNVLAAIGCAVLPTADEVIQKRRQNVELYNKALGKDWYATSPHCYPVRYSSREERDTMLEKLWENGVEARKAFSSLPTQEKVYGYMGYKLGDFPVAEKFGQTTLFLPVHQGLTEEDIKYICKLL